MLHPSRRHLDAVIRDETGKQLARCLLRRGRYIIGQDRKNEIVVDHPSVSARHARLTVVSEEEFLVEDLESANGTRVDGKPAQGLTSVSMETPVQIGATVLEFERASLPAVVFKHLPEGFLREHRYNFGEAVVQGSTSTIYDAYDTSLGRDLALKVMRPERQANPTHVLRFIREAQLTSQLQHPNILPIYELYLDEQSQLFYTTRFVEGETLSSILDHIAEGAPNAAERYPLTTLLTIFQKICDAVAFAHSRGLVHGGLQPDIISLGRYGEVFVGAWGLAKILKEDEKGEPFTHRFHAADPTGSPTTNAYSSHELAEGSLDQLNQRSDVYSLGGILYRMLTLHPPVAGPDEGVILEKILTGSIVPPAERAGEFAPHCPGGRIPEPLADLAMRCLSLDAAERPASVLAVQAEVSAWQTGLAHGEHGIWKQVSGLLGRH